MALRRGDIVWYDFALGGASILKTRPGVIIQNDLANRFSRDTIIASIRHDAGRALPVHVPVPKGVAGLKKDSVVDCGSVTTAPQAALESTHASLPDEYMARVDAALRVSLALR